MTFNEFLTKWNNQYCEVVDPNNKYQCFDLVVAWTDTLGLPRTFNFAYAYQIYASFGPSQAVYFDRIYNGPSAAPKEGDIVVWDWYYNYAGGHTGVATGKGVTTGAYTDWFECFEQNDPLRSNCHLKTYSYSHVMGWLRPKNYNLSLTWEQKGQQTITILKTTMTPDQQIPLIKKVFGV
jgi:hypothetical protein